MDFEEYKENLQRTRKQSAAEAEENALAFFAQWNGICQVSNNDGKGQAHCADEAQKDQLKATSLSWEK